MVFSFDGRNLFLPTFDLTPFRRVIEVDVYRGVVVDVSVGAGIKVHNFVGIKQNRFSIERTSRIAFDRRFKLNKVDPDSIICTQQQRGRCCCFSSNMHDLKWFYLWAVLNKDSVEVAKIAGVATPPTLKNKFFKTKTWYLLW